MRDARERVRDMIAAIDAVERYSSKGRDAFDGDELIQSWIVRHLQVIGEAARALPDDVRAKALDIDWKGITGMRHVLVHDYFEIDRELVWSTVERELTPLRAALERLLQRLNPA